LLLKSFARQNLNSPHATTLEQLYADNLRTILLNVGCVAGAPKRSLDVMSRRGETTSMICSKFAAYIRQISNFDAPEPG